MSTIDRLIRAISHLMVLIALGVTIGGEVDIGIFFMLVAIYARLPSGSEPADS